MKLEILNPEKFNYMNYEPNWWERLDLPYIFTAVDTARKIKDVVVGICDASRLQVRPRKDGFAVMCEDEYGYYWFHISDDVKQAFENV